MKLNNSINSQIRISVIMGIYNCENTLKEALDSLLAQTYKNFRVILCDDGSRDGSLKLALKYQELYPDKFLVIKNPSNMGLNYTLNHCLEYANTEYVARMDGDDISLPDRFATQIKFLDENPEYDFVTTSMICFDEKGDFMTLKLTEGSPDKIEFIKNSPFFHAPVLIRTKAYLDVGGYSVDKKLLRVEDYHLWFKLYANGFKGYRLSKPLYKMRDDRNATLRRTFQNRLNEMHIKLIIYKIFDLPYYYKIYAYVPLFKGLIPKILYKYLHRRKQNG